MSRRHQYISDDEIRDLGFGARVTQQSRLRLLNRDGGFNVARTGLSFFQSLDLYNSLLTMSWSRFYLSILVGFCSVNALFAAAYLLAGADALTGADNINGVGRFFDAFFFSVQTFTTVGYGHISPHTLAANIIAAVHAFIGVLSVALATGLLFARFSRPTARIAYSNSAIIAPYRGITAFEFRIANQRRSQLIDVEAKVLFAHQDTVGGVRKRHFQQLTLERPRVVFFPLSWTVVHPIDESSPLFGRTHDDLVEMEAEFLILLTATDEAFSQTVHSRSSYRYDEVRWGVRFADLFIGEHDGDGILRVNLHRLHDVDEASIP